jgi:hypothetical protein
VNVHRFTYILHERAHSHQKQTRASRRRTSHDKNNVRTSKGSALLPHAEQLGKWLLRTATARFFVGFFASFVAVSVLCLFGIAMCVEH